MSKAKKLIEELDGVGFKKEVNEATPEQIVAAIEKRGHTVADGVEAYNGWASGNRRDYVYFEKIAQHIIGVPAYQEADKANALPAALNKALGL